MKQVLIQRGKIKVENVPAPVVAPDTVLIDVYYSAISAGTELSSVKSGKEGLLKKAVKNKDKIDKIIKKIKTEGIFSAYRTVKEKLEKASAIGYSISGKIIEVGKNIKDLKPGDRVAGAGAGFATHSEFVNIPRNLVCKVPDGLDLKDASTVTLGAIALQGVRRADLKLGEFGVVLGTGILGLLTVQLLINSGVRVIAVDIDNRRLALARDYGAELILNPLKENIIKKVYQHTGGKGADAVIFTASTSSSEPLSQSFQMCRKKGRVVLVGVSGMEIKREDIYPKELDFMISTSYGPGRYDEKYEIKGIDYPYAYVRWTENRNMQEYLRLLKEGKISVKKMINEIYPVERADKAYNRLTSPQKPLIVLLEYKKEKKYSTIIFTSSVKKNFQKGRINVAIVGAGSFATNVHLPNLYKLRDKFNIYAIVSRTGYKARQLAERYNAKYSSTNYEDILSDKKVELVFICTRHNLHGEMVLKALNAGKNVFVEKPLCITYKELEQIKRFFKNVKNPPLLMVGFNRRFSKYAQEAKKFTQKRINPLFMHYRMNAGYIPLDHWVHTEEGGGRIIGEACHIIDLFSFFTESEIIDVKSVSLTPATEYFSSSDNKAIIIKYKDGSVGVLEYFAVGSREFPKEYMEIHFDEKTIVIDNYQKIEGYGIKVNSIQTKIPDKGHKEELEILYQSMKKKELPINLNTLFQTTYYSILAQNMKKE